MIRYRLPPSAPGLRIGLLGGSFNPPHAAHLLISRIALRRLGLDRIWWLVTPGNPLKDVSRLPDIETRMGWCRALIRDPRIIVTGIEATFGTRFTAETLDILLARRPGVAFVWLMGADNLVGFHRWQRWRDIAGKLPIAVIDRPGSTLRATASPFAHRFGPARIGPGKGRALTSRKPPVWVLLHDRRSPLSSTALRSRALK